MHDANRMPKQCREATAIHVETPKVHTQRFRKDAGTLPQMSLVRMFRPDDETPFPPAIAQEDRITRLHQVLRRRSELRGLDRRHCPSPRDFLGAETPTE